MMLRGLKCYSKSAFGTSLRSRLCNILIANGAKRTNSRIHWRPRLDFEPATPSLEGEGSASNFNVHSDNSRFVPVLGPLGNFRKSECLGGVFRIAEHTPPYFPGRLRPTQHANGRSDRWHEPAVSNSDNLGRVAWRALNWRDLVLMRPLTPAGAHEIKNNDNENSLP